VALGRSGEGVFEVARVEHTPAAVAALVARITALEPDAAEVRVVIETRHGLLVEVLLDAGYTVLPVNPDLVARRRGPARKKDDAEDARSPACWRWTGSPSCGPWSRTGSWPRSPAVPARASWSWRPGWPATATSPRRCSNGRSPACVPPAGRGSSTTRSVAAAGNTMPPCERWATAGWRSSGTA